MSSEEKEASHKGELLLLKGKSQEGCFSTLTKKNQKTEKKTKRKTHIAIQV